MTLATDIVTLAAIRVATAAIGGRRGWPSKISGAVCELRRTCLDKYRCIELAVTEAGSFARAAEALDMTPSGVSRAVARLEARLGVRLFARSPRSVALTEEGRRFHAQVLPLLTSIEEAATEAADASTAVSGRLRLSIDPWFSRMSMAPRLSRFLERHPRAIGRDRREQSPRGDDDGGRRGCALRSNGAFLAHRA